MDIVMSILRGLVYIIPAYIANSTPVFVGGGTPLDLGKKFRDGRRIFGDHKTIRGLVGGIIAGILISFLLPYLFPLVGIAKIGFIDALFLGLLLSLGTHTGDLLGSFIKRRLDLRPGSPAPILDQAGFVFFAFLFAYPFYPLIGLWDVIIIILITLLIHPVSNVIAYLLKLKEEPW